MKARIFSILIVALISSIATMGQSNPCIKDLDFLVQKIKADYPGYQDKVTAANKAQLVELERKLRVKMLRWPDSCYYFMNEYTDFFRDHHLRVRPVRNEPSKKTEIMDHSTYGKNMMFDEDSLQKASRELKGIEGVWKGFRESFGVIQDGQKLAGVVLEKEGWKKGQVAYEFVPLNDSLFEVQYHSLVNGRKPRREQASLHVHGNVLELHDDTRFVKKSGSDLYDKALLYAYVPQFPNGRNTYPVALYLDDSTFYLRIPGFYSNSCNETVLSHWEDIMARPNLIIDIRNNGGGQDNYYSELARLIYTRPYETKGVEWYASEGNIRLFEEAIKKGEIEDGEEGMKWTLALLEVMKKKKGEFVVHPYSMHTETLERMDTVYAMPRHVGIIINEGNASSAEQFLLAAKQSDKVILFGKSNTAGVLDYSNITPNPLPSGQYQLWCPMTRSGRLPENPIDNVGIAPDVIIPFDVTEQLYDKLDSWVYFVKNYLEFIEVQTKD